MTRERRGGKSGAEVVAKRSLRRALARAVVPAVVSRAPVSGENIFFDLPSDTSEDHDEAREGARFHLPGSSGLSPSRNECLDRSPSTDTGNETQAAKGNGNGRNGGPREVRVNRRAIRFGRATLRGKNPLRARGALIFVLLRERPPLSPSFASASRVPPFIDGRGLSPLRSHRVPLQYLGMQSFRTP